LGSDGSLSIASTVFMKSRGSGAVVINSHRLRLR
jgi:hypothetical protein